MRERFVATGGARVGWVNATWPLVRLTATADSLRVSVLLIGDYTFTPDQVTAITQYTSVFSCGIQIQHSVPEYPARLIFWTLGSPDAVLAGIQATGFRPQAQPVEASLQPQGMPFRWGLFIGVTVVWNVLLMLEMFSQQRPTPGPLMLLAVAFLFAGALAVLRLPAAQRIVLKPGRSVGEIQPYLRLVLLVSGMMLVVLPFFVLFQR